MAVYLFSVLLSNLSTRISGIVPDVPAQPTIKGLAEGRDEVLEKAVQLIEAS